MDKAIADFVGPDMTIVFQDGKSQLRYNGADESIQDFSTTYKKPFNELYGELPGELLRYYRSDVVAQILPLQPTDYSAFNRLFFKQYKGTSGVLMELLKGQSPSTIGEKLPRFYSNSLDLTLEAVGASIMRSRLEHQIDRGIQKFGFAGSSPGQEEHERIANSI
ncbi:unnamed protein product [Bursaphelenchus xylophilus]|uniref:(pine wood nematode) hypothetical protein n=1 Tax=Bursaphelenchus xylophilus TaxID=6326 RepID=A0A1I7SQM7_BURXY|nr:unnamed protein product [Bursaphelenchus xylophilus]CAG9110115.1 unnamed protein product [Bursaphelenchus xylophilus]